MKRSEGGFLVSKIHQLSRRIFNKLLKEQGITFNSAQGRILFVLWKKDAASSTRSELFSAHFILKEN